MKKITIKDVASQANVSTATVSHVINKTRYVEKDTEARVVEAIRQLNYYPNILAQGLKGKGTKTIGIIIADIRESFFASLVKSIESYLRKKDFSLILCDSEDTVRQEKKHLNLLLQKGVEGVIFAPINIHETYSLLQTSHIPVVQVDRKTYGLKSDYIGIHNVQSAQRAVEHLCAHGYTRIGFIGYDATVYTMRKRMEGYKAALSQRNMFDEHFIKIVHYSDNSMQKSIKHWLLDGKIDAIICAVDEICYAALGAIEELELHIPDDIGLISYDDSKWLKYLKTPITVIRQPVEKMGRAAAETIIQRIQHPTKSDFFNIRFETDLILRGSCGRHEATVEKYFLQEDLSDLRR
ncbi:MAG: LacI family DNA-binding transcriptional regulator [Candidatus Vecturithrix sp.]|nr:LacI family DNA-binding transcriptional regulator [Candidatus Vecturithrix sp.]